MVLQHGQYCQGRVTRRCTIGATVRYHCPRQRRRGVLRPTSSRLVRCWGRSARRVRSSLTRHCCCRTCDSVRCRCRALRRLGSTLPRGTARIRTSITPSVRHRKAARTKRKGGEASRDVTQTRPLAGRLFAVTEHGITHRYRSSRRGPSWCHGRRRRSCN